MSDWEINEALSMLGLNNAQTTTVVAAIPDATALVNLFKTNLALVKQAATLVTTPNSTDALNALGVANKPLVDQVMALITSVTPAAVIVANAIAAKEAPSGNVSRW